MVARRVRPTDAQSVTALIHTVGWQQTADDVEALLTREGTNVLGTFEEAAFDDGDGELLSMAAMQTFRALPAPGSGYEWLCYVASAPQARRRGLASALIATLLSSVPVGSSIGLFGSVDGAPLYEKHFGFVDCGYAQLFCMNKAAISKVHAPAELPDCSLVNVVQALPEVLALDRQCYGVDRGKALSKWASESPGVCWALLASEGQALGFLLVRPMHPGSGVFLGPLVARTEAEAEALLRTTLASLPPEVEEVGMLVIDVRGSPAGDGEGLFAPRPFAAAGYEFG